MCKSFFSQFEEQDEQFPEQELLIALMTPFVKNLPIYYIPIKIILQCSYCIFYSDDVKYYL
jgi:hypothetical protein